MRVLYKNKKKLDLGGIVEDLGGALAKSGGGEDEEEDGLGGLSNLFGGKNSSVNPLATPTSGSKSNSSSTFKNISQFTDPLASIGNQLTASYENKQSDRYGLDATTTTPGADKAAQAITSASALTPFSAEGEGIGKIIKGFGTSTHGTDVLQPYGIKYNTYNNGMRAGDIAGGVAETGTSAALTAFGVPAPIANAIGKGAGQLVQAPATIIGDNVNLSGQNLKKAGSDVFHGDFKQGLQQLWDGSSNDKRQIEQRRVMNNITGIKNNQALQSGFQQYATLTPKFERNVMTRYARRGGRLFFPLFKTGGQMIQSSGNFRRSFEDGGGLNRTTYSGMSTYMDKGGKLHNEVITHLRSKFSECMEKGGEIPGAPWNNSGKVQTFGPYTPFSGYKGIVANNNKQRQFAREGYPLLNEKGGKMGITNGGTYKKGGGGFPAFNTGKGPAKMPLYYYHGGAVILGGQLHSQHNKEHGAGNPIFHKGVKVAETEREELLLNKNQTEQLEAMVKKYDQTGDEQCLYNIGVLMQKIIDHETVDSSGKVLKKGGGGPIIEKKGSRAESGSPFSRSYRGNFTGDLRPGRPYAFNQGTRT